MPPHRIRTDRTDRQTAPPPQKVCKAPQASPRSTGTGVMPKMDRCRLADEAMVLGSPWAKPLKAYSRPAQGKGKTDSCTCGRGRGGRHPVAGAVILPDALLDLLEYGNLLRRRRGVRSPLGGALGQQPLLLDVRHSLLGRRLLRRLLASAATRKRGFGEAALGGQTHAMQQAGSTRSEAGASRQTDARCEASPASTALCDWSVVKDSRPSLQVVCA
jgi:hypothetical protein